MYDHDRSSKHYNKSIRLPHYNYSSAGGYFVTLCTANRTCVFGEIVDGVMELSKIGQIVEEEWLRTPQIRPTIKLDEFIIMPNHLHGIVIFSPFENDVNGTKIVAAHSCVPLQSASKKHDLVRTPRSLSSMIAGFKATSTKRVNDELKTPGVKLWQRNFFERVIRNDDALSKAREYIVNNPLKWYHDKENPDNIPQQHTAVCLYNQRKDSVISLLP